MTVFVRSPRQFALVCIGLVLAAFALSGWYLAAPESDPVPTRISEDPSVAPPEIRRTRSSAEAPPSDLVGRPRPVPVPESMPGSLAGTSVPGGWAQVDAAGDLVPTLALRQMFEYYLSALGEESLEQLVARIEQTLLALSEPARTQAMDTLGAYLDYKLAISDLDAGYGGRSELEATEMRRRMEEIQALRRTWLDSATADAFFAHDEAIDRFQVEKPRIGQDEALSDEQRQRALEEAEQALPEPMRKARRETRRFANYEQARLDLADDPEALRDWRQKAFGAEAAQRLEALEQEQANWNRRWQAYSEARADLLSSGLAGPELQGAIDHLRNQHFSEVERVRAQALDSIR